MNNPEATYQLITSYLLGQLSGQELTDFESRLATDTELKEIVELEKMAYQTVVQTNLSEVRTELNEEFDQLRHKEKRAKKLWITAGVVAVISVSAVFFGTRDWDSGKPASPKEKSPLEQSSSDSQAKALPAIKDLDSTTYPESEAAPTLSLGTKRDQEEAIEALVVTIAAPVQKEVEDEGIREEKQLQEPESEPSPAPTDPPEKEDQPCQTYTLSCKHMAPCQGEATSITISVTGGTGPFEYIFDDESLDSPIIADVYDGTYEVQTKDEKGCLSDVLVVTVEEEFCYRPKATFSPSYGESWTYESNNEEISLQIVDIAGREVFGAITVDPTWDGTDKNGNLAKVDVYFYFVKKEGKLVEQGQITLTQ